MNKPQKEPTVLIEKKFYKEDRDGNLPGPSKHLVPRGELKFVHFEKVKVQAGEYYDLDERGEPPKSR